MCDHTLLLQLRSLLEIDQLYQASPRTRRPTAINVRNNLFATNARHVCALPHAYHTLELLVWADLVSTERYDGH
eukprot:629464-Amphidinium_carterae.1